MHTMANMFLTYLIATLSSLASIVPEPSVSKRSKASLQKSVSVLAQQVRDLHEDHSMFALFLVSAPP